MTGVWGYTLQYRLKVLQHPDAGIPRQRRVQWMRQERSMDARKPRHDRIQDAVGVACVLKHAVMYTSSHTQVS